MGRRITPVVVVLLCVYFDTVFFPRVNLLGMRPDAMLAATVSFAVLHGPFMGAALGAAGGILSDLIGGTAIGLSAAIYLVAGVAGGFFYKKFYADNVVVPALTAITCGLAKDIFMAIVRAIGGARFSFGAMFLQYILPSALMSGLLCILFHLALKPLAARQIKRQHAEH
ncbi:rod shape-determining protein MreD [Christensenellaceae bacterium OttesenSCG-928-M15]|nr:rod shape-determining protein MreD [Christensenellaceae bacterium OttesenSCG-928-M15]